MVDSTNQWSQTLEGVSREQIKYGIDQVRTSGRKWPPAAPEFRSICLSAGAEKHAPLEACFAELTAFVTAGRKDTYNLSPILYHTVTKNLDFYNYKKIEKDWERIKSFEIAYKATLFQLECGDKLDTPPDPKTLIENKSDKPVNTKANNAIAEQTIGGLMDMLKDKEDQQ